MCVKAELHLLCPSAFGYARDYQEVMATREPTTDGDVECETFHMMASWRTSMRQATELKSMIKTVQAYSSGDKYMADMKQLDSSIRGKSCVGPVQVFDVLSKFVLLKAKVRPGSETNLRSILADTVDKECDVCSSSLATKCESVADITNQIALVDNYEKMFTSACEALEAKPRWASWRHRCKTEMALLLQMQALKGFEETVCQNVTFWKTDYDFSGDLKLTEKLKDSLTAATFPESSHQTCVAILEQSNALLKLGCRNKGFLALAEIVAVNMVPKEDAKKVKQDYQALASLPDAWETLDVWKQMLGDNTVKIKFSQCEALKKLLQCHAAFHDLSASCSEEQVTQAYESLVGAKESATELALSDAEKKLDEIFDKTALKVPPPGLKVFEWHDGLDKNPDWSDIKKHGEATVLKAFWVHARMRVTVREWQGEY